MDEHDPDTWGQPFNGGRLGYIRTKGTDRRLALQAEAPRAFQAQADAVGGADRLPDHGENLIWRDAAIGNLRVAAGVEWEPPGPRQAGWHKDGWHFRHFLNSPEQGLLTVPIYSDIQPRSGGTFIAPDSIRPVAQLLAQHAAGLHPDSVQGSGYLIPGLIEQCSRFEELTGKAGDMALLHPYMLHRVSVNPSTRPRFIANMALVLTEPMRFNRPAGETVLAGRIGRAPGVAGGHGGFPTDEASAAFQAVPVPRRGRSGRGAYSAECGDGRDGAGWDGDAGLGGGTRLHDESERARAACCGIARFSRADQLTFEIQARSATESPRLPVPRSRDGVIPTLLTAIVSGKVAELATSVAIHDRRRPDVAC